MKKSQLREIIREEVQLLIEGNSAINKKVRDLLTTELNDLSNGGPDIQFAIMHILIGALVDANFHPEAKKVESIFRNAKYGGDPKNEKDDIKKYQYTIGTKIAKMCDWDGGDIVDSIGFYTSMTVGRPIGDRIEKLVEDMNKTKSVLTEWRAEEVLKQLGGNKFIAMTGAKQFVKSDKEKQITFKIGGGAKGGINYIRITLTSMDLYDVEFLRLRANDLKVVAKEKGVYNDELQSVFTKYTGMRTSL